MKKTTILVLVLILGVGSMASAAGFSVETKEDTGPISCVGPIGSLMGLFGMSCGPDSSPGKTAEFQGDQKSDNTLADSPGDTTTREIKPRRTGGR